MDLVKWHADERVDIPDITAMSFLVLGEFRRAMRLLAGDTLRKVVRGFKVEPESPVSTRVRIRLDPTGGGVRGKALGAENLTSGIDYGQLIGDRDSYFDNEGQAQQLLDLSGQPVGTYFIEMRFTYADGASDNRAFWNNGTLSEYVNAVNTRRIAGWEARYISGAVGTGNEWIPLATVAWDGVAVDAGEITDKRDMLFEGQGPTFQQATQTGAGGQPDFDRSTTRGDVSPADVVAMLRALARQVQDIKGQSDTGMFDWFSRPFSAMDPSNSLGDQTKTLRTIEHIMYTVSDGTTEYGDFSSLHTCLTLIATEKATLPRFITIVLKTRSTGSPAWDLSGTYALGDKRIRIVGGYGGGNGVLARSVITCSTVAASNIFSFTTNGGLELENLYFSNPTNEVTMFSLPVSNGLFVARNCQFVNTGSRTRVYADLPSTGLWIERCVMGSLLTGGGVWQIADASILTAQINCGSIKSTWFGGTRLKLFRQSGGALTGRTFGLRIADCSITGNITPHTAGDPGAMIYALAARAVTFDNCDITWNPDEDAMFFGGLFDSTPTLYQSGDIEVLNCRFACYSPTHAAGAGLMGATGTGWGIHFSGDSPSEPARKLVVKGCSFTGQSIDAGGMRIANVSDVEVHGCSWYDAAHVGAGDSYTAINLTASSAHNCGAVISHCQIRNWDGAKNRTRGIILNSVNDVTISKCVIRGDDSGGGAITGRTNVDCGVRIVSCDDVRIEGCSISHWNPGETTSAALRVPSGSVCERMSIRDCSFNDNGSYAIEWTGDGGSPVGIGPSIQGCAIDGAGDNDQLGITLAAGAGSRWTVSNNRIRLNTGVGQDAIFFNNMGGGVCMGNESNGDIRRTGATAIRGFNEGGQDLNSVNAYT